MFNEFQKSTLQSITPQGTIKCLTVNGWHMPTDEGQIRTHGCKISSPHEHNSSDEFIAAFLAPVLTKVGQDHREHTLLRV